MLTYIYLRDSCKLQIWLIFARNWYWFKSTVYDVWFMQNILGICELTNKFRISRNNYWVSSSWNFGTRKKGPLSQILYLSHCPLFKICLKPYPSSKITLFNVITTSPGATQRCRTTSKRRLSDPYLHQNGGCF